MSVLMYQYIRNIANTNILVKLFLDLFPFIDLLPWLSKMRNRFLADLLTTRASIAVAQLKKLASLIPIGRCLLAG